MKQARAIVVFLVLCVTGFSAPKGEDPGRFYIVAEAYSDASPFWHGYVLDVQPDGGDLRVRWIRVRPLLAGCPPPVTVQLAERRLANKTAKELLGRANPCKTSKSEVERAYQQRRVPDMMDHPVNFGIVAACADGEKVFHLPQFAWDQENTLKSRTNRVWRLRNLYRDVVLKTFRQKGPFWDITDEEDFQLQLDGQSVVNDLRAGVFDGGLLPCGEPGCGRSWAEILSDYRGPIHVAEAGPKVTVLADESLPEGLKFLDFVAPTYPPLARQARIQGVVRLGLKYDPESGAVTGVTPDAGHPLLIPAAVAVARKWKLDAASSGAKPVTVALRFTMTCP